MNSLLGLPTFGGDAERWFFAVLMFESSIEEEWHDPAIRASYRLIRASGPEEAYAKALRVGRDNESIEHHIECGHTVRWDFKGLSDLDEVIDEPCDGSEVYGYTQEGVAEDFIVEKEDLAVFVTEELEE